MDSEWREERVAPEGCGVVEVCRLFEDAARHHATHLGLGVEDLHAAGKAWVLSRLALRVERFPEPGEKLLLGTWPSRRTSGVRAWRDLELRSPGGALLAEAASVWLVVDRETKRVLRLPAEFSSFRYPEKDTGVAPMEAWESGGEADRVQWRLVVEADLDENRHANNVAYVAWGWEAVGRPARKCVRLDVDYRGEALLGDSVQILEWSNEGETRQMLRADERVITLVRWVWR